MEDIIVMEAIEKYVNGVKMKVVLLEYFDIESENIIIIYF